MVLRRDRGLPAGLDHDGLVRLDDDGGALDLVAGRELVARVDGRRRAIAPPEKNLRARARARASFAARRLARLLA